MPFRLEDPKLYSFQGTIVKTLFKGLAKTLDLFVAPAFSAPGYWLRRRSWRDPELRVDLSKQHHIVTGANSGLGFACARQLATRGATVHMLCRNADRGAKARDQILAEDPESRLFLHVVDVSLTQSVRDFASDFQGRFERLDGLIHNAGVLPHSRAESAEGVELTFATNVLGPFLLTLELQSLLQKSAPSRVIFVSSGGMYTQKLNVEDLQFTREPFDGVVAYAQTKRAEVILAEMFAARLKDRGITVNSMHPGWADTPGVQKSLPGFRKVTKFMLRDYEQGADTMVWLAAAKELEGVTGQFWFDRAPRRTHLPFSKTHESEDDRQALWQACERLSGVSHS